MSSDQLVAFLFAGAALVMAGIAAVLAYEAVVVWQRRRETISNLSATSFHRVPRPWIAAIGALCYVLGALTTHFTGWAPG